MTTESCMTFPSLRSSLTFLAQSFYGAQLRDGARELGLRLGQLELVLAVAHGLFGPLFRRQRGGFIEIARPRRRVGEHRHQMRLNLERAAAHVERVLLVADLHPHFARLERAQEGGVARPDADFALRR